MAATPYIVLAAGMLADVDVGSPVDLDDQSAHHLTQVLRRRIGSPLVATDGSGREVEATLQTGSIVVSAVRDVARPSPRIEVAQAVGKGRKHDDVVRMLTEVLVADVDGAGIVAAATGRMRSASSDG